MGRASLDCAVPACTARHSTHKQSNCPVRTVVGFFASTSCLSKMILPLHLKKHSHSSSSAPNGLQWQKNGQQQGVQFRGGQTCSGKWGMGGAGCGCGWERVDARGGDITSPLHSFYTPLCLVHRAEHRQYCTLYCTYQVLRTAPRGNAAGNRLGR